MITLSTKDAKTIAGLLHSYFHEVDRNYPPNDRTATALLREIDRQINTLELLLKD